MKILVSVKRVPDPETKIKIAAAGNGIVTDGVKFVMNPFDEIAVEEALRIQEKHGGEVVVISIGGPEVVEQIRTALAMGAERGIHIHTTEKIDSDVAARLLHKIALQENADLFLLGKQAIDDDANQTGQILATLWEASQACFAYKVDVQGNKIVTAREVDGGIETVEQTLPAVITTDLRLNEPRYASLPGIMKAKRKEVKEIAAATLGVDLTPKVTVKAMSAPKTRGGTKTLQSVDELIAVLRNDAKVF